MTATKQYEQGKAYKSVVMVVVLWGLVLVSALAVVASTHATRQRLHDLEVLRKQSTQLQVAWGQYLLERSAWGAYSRIEREAVEQLRMQVPAGDSLIMVTP
jgi:cell division protein FtsL